MKSEKFWLSLLLSRNEKWKENEWKWNFLRISEITRKMRILTTFLFSKNKNKPKIWYWLIVPCNHSQDLFKIIMIINHLECWRSWSSSSPASFCIDLLSTTLRIYSWAKGVSTLCTRTICLPLNPLWSIINLYCHHYHLLSLSCRTTLAEKLCLQWNDFKNNTIDAIERLREDNDFSDVTLACEDGQLMEAHKVILAVSSPFFRRLLKKIKHPHPLIYMRGIKSEDLMSIIDFLYRGEANVCQELQLKGLTGQTNNDAEVGEEEVAKTCPRRI